MPSCIPMTIFHAVRPVAYNSWLFPLLSFTNVNKFCPWWWCGKSAFIMILGGQFLSLLGQTTPGTPQASFLSLCDRLAPVCFTDMKYLVNLCLNSFLHLPCAFCMSCLWFCMHSFHYGRLSAPDN